MSDAGKPALRVEVSYDLCVGVGMCVQHAPGAFDFNDVGQSIFDPEGDWTLKALREAADSCPMNAITIVEP